MKRVLAFIGCFIYTGISLHAQTEAKDFTMADSLVKAEQYEKGLELLNKLINKYGEKEQYLSDRGLAYLATNDAARAKADFLKALTLNPECTRCLGNLGIMEVDNGNFAAAISYLEKYIQLKPAEAMGYVKRGEARFQLHNYDEAIADFNKGLELDINSPYIYLYRSMTQLAKGDSKAAMTDINKSIQYKPEVEFAYYIRGKIYIKLGDYRAAVKDLFSCLQKNPKVPEYNTYAGIALYYLDDYNKAMQAFNESLKLDSSDYLPFQYRSYLLYSDAAFTKACIDKQRALAIASATENTEAVTQIQQEMDEYCDLSKPGSHYHSGQVLFGQAAFDKAKLAYSNGLLRFPNDPILLEGRGNAAIATGQFSEALGYYNQCLSHLAELNIVLLIKETSTEKKKAASDFFLSQLYNSIAFAHINLLHIDTAITWMGKAIDVLQKNPSVEGREKTLSGFLVKRSGFLRLQNDEKAAAADLAAALILNPQNAEAYIIRAQALILKNTYDAEINKDKPATVFQPNDPNKTVSMEYITTPAKNWNKKEIEDALADYDKAITYDPGNREAYMLRAQAKLLLKKDNYCDDILQAKKSGVVDAAKRMKVTCN